MKNIIKQAFMDGMSLEDILDVVEDARVEVENETALDLDECRDALVVAILDYIDALGIIPDDMIIEDEDIKALSESLKDAEEDIKKKASVLKMIGPMVKLTKAKTPKKDADAALKDWVDSLVQAVFFYALRRTIAVNIGCLRGGSGAPTNLYFFFYFLHFLFSLFFYFPSSETTSIF